MLYGIPWFAWIAIVAMVGGMYFSYKMEKLKTESKLNAKSEELEGIRKVLSSLKVRLENLEAIAAQAPDDFGKSSNPEIEIPDEDDASVSNREEVSKLANDLRTK